MWGRRLGLAAARARLAAPRAAAAGAARGGAAGCRACAASASRARAFGDSAAEPAVGAAGLDWANIGFDFQKTRGYVKYTWRHGAWDAGVFEPEPYLKIHVRDS